MILKNAIPLLFILTISSNLKANTSYSGAYIGAGNLSSVGFLERKKDNTDEIEGDSNLTLYVGYNKVFSNSFLLGIEYSHNSNESIESFSNSDRLEIKLNNVVNTHIGYHFTSAALYAIAGIGKLKYNATLNNITKQDDKLTGIYGIGFSYRFSQHFSCNIDLTATAISENFTEKRALGIANSRLALSFHF